MTTCNICKGPMKVLLTSWYCPNDCDRKPKEQARDYHLVERCDGRMWRVAAICAGEVIPAWTTMTSWREYVQYTPDQAVDLVHQKDAKEGLYWTLTHNPHFKTVPDRYKDIWWVLALTPET